VACVGIDVDFNLTDFAKSFHTATRPSMKARTVIGERAIGVSITDG
jgi:hypothetical protein